MNRTRRVRWWLLIVLALGIVIVVLVVQSRTRPPSPMSTIDPAYQTATQMVKEATETNGVAGTMTIGFPLGTPTTQPSP